MGRIIFLFLVMIFFCVDTTLAQTDTILQLQQQKFIEGNYTNFYVDNFNNIYLINSENQIKKINKNGDSLAVSNAQKRFGDIYSMDVSNPLKILVYYKEFATIVILDRFLSNVNTIDLRKIGIQQAQAIALSYDNNYWVFDALENKLTKIDDNGNILLTTPDFRTAFDEAFQPSTIIDNNGFVYLYNRNYGWMIFDYYGAFKQKIPEQSLQNVEVIKDDLFGFDSLQNLNRYNTKTFKETVCHFNTNTTNNLKYQLDINILYALTKNGLYTFSINY